MSYYGGGEASGGGNDWTPSQSGPGQQGRLAPPGEIAGTRLATPLQRIAAALIDWVPAGIVIRLFSEIVTGHGTQRVCSPGSIFACYDQQTEQHALSFLGWLLAVGWIAYNQVWFQARTGQSLGKRALRLQLVFPVRRRDDTEFLPTLPSVGRCAARAATDFLQGFLCFAPSLIMVFFTFYRQSLGDKVTSTAVLGPNHGLQFQRVDPATVVPAI